MEMMFYQYLAESGEVERDFGKSEIVKNAFAALKAKKATYKTANEFAIEIGDILSKALGASLSTDKLPDGKMILQYRSAFADGRARTKLRACKWLHQ